MQYTQLGRTGLKVSRLCLGTMNFGPMTTEADSFAVMDKAIELGINFFDTADVYGWKKGEGWTEQIIGKWFAQGGGRREHTILATKVFGGMDATDTDRTMMAGLSALKIRRACENSLKRLQTDYLDLYQMHHIAREMPWEECLQAFDTLIQQGKIVYFGSSNFAGWHIAAAQRFFGSHGKLGLVSEQSIYSLLDRKIEMEVLPACQHYGVGVIPWSPLASGLLGGVLKKTDNGRTAQEGNKKKIERLRPQLEKWETWCDGIGEKPADVALAWMLHNPAITSPIIGPRTMDQLTGSLRAVEIKLTVDQLKELDELFPGPRNLDKPATGDWTKQAAPEAYAW